MQLPSLLLLLLLLSLGCGPAIPAGAAPVASSLTNPAASIPWDKAFPLRSDPAPLHFVAHYIEPQDPQDPHEPQDPHDPHGSHRLEEWRLGTLHLRRLTDSRIDLHADATSMQKPNLPADYLWQIIDRNKRVLHRLSSQAMLHAGMLYNFYSMAHVLSRPAGPFVLTQLTPSQVGEPRIYVGGLDCTWFQLSPEGQPASRICWSQETAIPLKIEMQTREGTWIVQMFVESLDRKAIPATIFAVDTHGLQVRNIDEMQQED